MSQIFDKEGNPVSVTLIEAGPCFVTQLKNKEKDGYTAFQIGFLESKKLNKPAKGHLKKAKVSTKYLSELRIEKDENLPKIGEKIDVSLFKKGDLVEISGNTKGRGFQGVIKRHGFHRGPMAHGSDHHREPGSIGSAYPQRVVKGTKLPGRMGVHKITIKKVKVLKVIPDKNVLVIRGQIPGPNGNLISIKSKVSKEKVEATENKEARND